MQSAQMRPTFSIPLSLPARDVAAAMRLQILKQGFENHTRSAGLVTEFFIDPRECRYWSPHLSTQLHDTEDGGSELFGRFSPRPEVWTLVMFVYSMAICVIFGALIWAYAQWMLKATPWALALVPISFLSIGLLHLVSLIGQRWSSDQILILRERLDHVMQGITNANDSSDR